MPPNVFMADSAGLLRRGVKRQTVLSPCENYRYCLWRQWTENAGEYVVFIGLNPSTADETIDDPTIRRCIGFTRQWGYNALCMVNLFAFRATQPGDLKKVRDPVGALNDKFLRSLIGRASRVVACWGNHGSYQGRDAHVRRLIRTGECFGLTKASAPRHPLYVRYDKKLCSF